MKRPQQQTPTFEAKKDLTAAGLGKKLDIDGHTTPGTLFAFSPRSIRNAQ